MLKKLLLASFFTLGTFGLGFSDQNQPVKAYSDYIPLAANHEKNNYENFDGVTCAVIVLNSLELQTEEATSLGDKTIYTQENIFNGQVSSIVDAQTVKKRGIAIEELTQIFPAYGLKAQAKYPHIMTNDALKEVVVTTLKDPMKMMIVQYEASLLTYQQKVSYAVVADYDAKTDSILLLNPDDTKKAKMWVKTQDLLKSMQSLDENHTPRGYIIVEKPVD